MTALRYVLSSPTTSATQKLLDYYPKYLVKHGEFTSRTEGSVEVNLNPGLYIVVPCTFTPGKVGAFDLRTICHDPEAIVPPLLPLKEPAFLSIKVRNELLINADVRRDLGAEPQLADR